MPFTQEQFSAIRAALEKKAKDICPICAGTDLYLVNRVTLLPLCDPPFEWLDPPALMPCIAVNCKNCGFVSLFNVHTLGIAEAVGVPPPGKPIGIPPPPPALPAEEKKDG